jgi:hypothetical protein
MGDVGSVADAISNGEKLALTFINPPQNKLMTQQDKEQFSDENQFKKNLLAHDAANCTLQLNGCVCTNPPELAAGEYDQLRSIRVNLDAATVLRLFCCSKESDALRKQLQIALTTTKG